jgi:hypothetical protein
MRIAMLLAVMLSIASLVGCGAVADHPVSVTPPVSTDSIKAALNDVIKTGELGSGGSSLEMDIEQIRSTDAAKADALKKAYDELKASADPGKRKAKAQEMMSKL